MSVYNPQIPQSFLQELETMSTDIRQQKKDIAAAKAAAQVAQGTATTARSVADAATSAIQVISGTVQTISAEMVRKFTSAPIVASAFVLDAVSGYYYATVSHMLGDASPDVEVYDNDKDKQAVQSILVDNNTIKLELSADELASNSFPLTCIVLGKNTPVQPVLGAWETIPGGTRDYRLMNGNIEWTMDLGATVTTFMSNVVEAFICTQEGSIFAKLTDGTYISKADGATASTQEEEGDYLFRKALPDSIALI